MTLFATIGKAHGLSALEAAIQATDHALSQVGRQQVVLAFIVASHDYPVRDVVNGVTGLLSDTPLFGFSSPTQITSERLDQRSIVVALLAGDQVEAEGSWWSESSFHDTQYTRDDLHAICNNYSDIQLLLSAIDLHIQDPQSMIDKIPSGLFGLGGCLVGGNLSSERSYQIGGNRFGQRGMAAVALRGQIKTAISSEHGWQSIGIYSRVSHSSDYVIHTLDGQTVADKYAQFFGLNAKDWTYPPLNHLVRLYPLGVEWEKPTPSGESSLKIHSPLRMNTNGSMLMNSPVTKGSTAYYLISSIENCLSAAKRAARQALEALGDAEPVLAIVIADIAWQMMLPAQPGAEIQAVREVIGEHVPIVGGYTYGQIRRSGSGLPELLNQHIQIVLIGNPT
jgi:hypothetical protein